MQMKKSDTYSVKAALTEYGDLILVDPWGSSHFISGDLSTEQMHAAITESIRDKSAHIAQHIMDDLQPGPLHTQDKP